MKSWIGPLAFGAVTMAAIALFSMVMVSCDDGFQRERERKQKRIADQRCYVSGYYGRSGEYKIYNCMGWIVKERDL